MLKRILTLLLVFSLMSVTNAHQKIQAAELDSIIASTTAVDAATNWWGYFKDAHVGSSLGALDGYLQTDSVGGALGGSLKGAIAASLRAGVVGRNWEVIDSEEALLGNLHNEGLVYIYQRFEFNSSEISSEDWSKIDRVLLTFLWEKRLYTKEIDAYVRAMDFSYEAMMKRIYEATTVNANYPISVNFYPNLEKALKNLMGEVQRDIDLVGDALGDLDNLIETFNVFLVEAAEKESGEDLTRQTVNGGYSKIEVTYKPQKSMNVNNDIILANLVAHFSKRGYDYYKSKSDSALKIMDIIILVPKRAGIMQSNLIDLEIPPKIKGLEIVVDRVDASVGIDEVTLDVAPFIENSRTMVPFRFIGESLGAQVGWNPDESSVTYVLGEQTVKLYIGRSIAIVNGKEVAIDENPQIVPLIVNSRTMVPVRFISETLGFEVSWDPQRRAVGIVTNPYFVSNELSGDMILD
jgi:hypothetical protein